MSTEQDYGFPCRLYLVSPPSFELSVFERQLREALNAGDVGAFQLRLKNASDEAIVQAAERLKPLCEDKDVAFIINDRPDIADAVRATGVHMGQEDLMQMPISKVRQIVGADAIIGISCHDSSHMAMQAGDDGADYVAFGAFYPTQSKPAEKLAKYGTPKPDMLEWWYQYTVLPCVAIGGITPQNCGPLVTAGADFIGVITGVWSHPEGPAAAVSAYNNAIKEALKARTPAEAA